MSQLNFKKKKSRAPMRKSIPLSSEKIVGVIMIIAGLIGLGMQIEYSGWVLFFGILAALD